MRLMPKLFRDDLPSVVDWIRRFISLEETKVDVDPVQVVGTRALYYGATAPDGWLLIDNSFVSRELYPELFNAIGTTFGSGVGTFRLPPAPTPDPNGIWLIRARS
jgi:hypothetical protein